MARRRDARGSQGHCQQRSARMRRSVGLPRPVGDSAVDGDPAGPDDRARLGITVPSCSSTPSALGVMAATMSPSRSFHGPVRQRGLGVPLGRCAGEGRQQVVETVNQDDPGGRAVESGSRHARRTRRGTRRSPRTPRPRSGPRRRPRRSRCPRVGDVPASAVGLLEAEQDVVAEVSGVGQRVERAGGRSARPRGPRRSWPPPPRRRWSESKGRSSAAGVAPGRHRPRYPGRSTTPRRSAQWTPVTEPNRKCTLGARPEDGPDRVGDVARFQTSGGHLVEEGLERVEVALVDEGDVDRRPRLGGPWRQPARRTRHR